MLLSLENAEVPSTDRFQRFLKLDKENFNHDLHYPDLAEPRTDRFVLIEILFSVGRSVKIKQKILCDMLEHLQVAGIRRQVRINLIIKSHHGNRLCYWRRRYRQGFSRLSG